MGCSKGARGSRSAVRFGRTAVGGASGTSPRAAADRERRILAELAVQRPPNLVNIPMLLFHPKPLSGSQLTNGGGFGLLSLSQGACVWKNSSLLTNNRTAISAAIRNSKIMRSLWNAAGSRARFAVSLRTPLWSCILAVESLPTN